jgi:hypothetical protein
MIPAESRRKNNSMSTTTGATRKSHPEGQSILARFSTRARVVTALTASLSAMGLAASLATFPGVASASTPVISASGDPSSPVVFDVTGAGGFTPGGNVRVEVDYNGAAVYSTTVAASEPRSQYICFYYGVKPHCQEVTIPGGRFSTTVNDGGVGTVCNAPPPVYVIKATDLTSGAVATTQVTGRLECIEQS